MPGLHPVIVNCGSGASFDAPWRLAGRATPSHSALTVDGMSSSRFTAGGGTHRRALSDVPQMAVADYTRAIDGARLKISHDGYRQTHGLVAMRTIGMGLDGTRVTGEDQLIADTGKDRHGRNTLRFTPETPPQAQVRFHIHPDVQVRLDLGGSAVSLTLKNGQVWVFRHDGTATLSLEPSVYLQHHRVHPRATDQIVLSWDVTGPDTHVRWSLAKAGESA